MKLENIFSCSRCSLCYTEINKDKGIPIGWGPGRDILILGLAPSDFRGKTKYAMKPLSDGDTASILMRVVNSFEEMKSKFYVTNIVKCSFPDNVLDHRYLDICFNEWLLKELVTISPKKIVCLGEEVFNFIDSKPFMKYIFDVKKVWHHSYVARQTSQFDNWREQWERVISD